MMTWFEHKRQMTNEELSELFRASYPRLYRVAYSLLADAEESRDVVHDTIADLLDKHRLTPDVGEALLVTAVRNRALDLLRHRRVEDEARQALLHEYQTSTTDTASEERIREIRHYIETELTPQTRRVLQLCYDEKKTYQEAANLLDISVQAINKHISQALRKLREEFNSKNRKS